MMFFLWNSSLLAGHEEIIKRMEKIQKKKEALEVKETDLTAFKKQIDEYKSPKLLEEEKDIIKSSQAKLSGLLNESSNTIEFLKTAYLDKRMSELKKNEDDLKQFRQKESHLNNLRKGEHSKMLKKYIKLIDEGKYNLAQAVFYTLKADDKKIAEDFETTFNEVAFNQNSVESWEKEIKSLDKKINEELDTLERDAEELQVKFDGTKTDKEEFDKILKAHELDQFKLNFGANSQLEFFECKNKPEYLMPRHTPGVMLLKSGDGLKAALKLDPQSPNGYQVIDVKISYNQERLLCRLDPVCEESLNKFESLYKRETFFPQVDSDLLSWKINNLKNHFTSPVKSELLIYEDMKQMGYYSKQEYTDMINPLLEYAQNLKDCKAPADCQAKILAKLAEVRKFHMDRLAEKNKLKPDPTKLRHSENLISYIFTGKIESDINRLFKSKFFDYPIQDRALEKCSEKAIEWKDFCEAGKAWKERLKLFDDAEELKNINTKDCSKGIFRVSPQSSAAQLMCGEGGVVNDLEKDMDAIYKKIGP